MIPILTSALPARHLGRLLTAVAALAVGIPLSRSQTPATTLAPLVVTADRWPESAATVGAASDVITGTNVAQAQFVSLADALATVPGVPVFASGQTGAIASVFLRGANSDQTLFLVDGLRLNDGNVNYNGFITGARLFPGDTIEIVRGPQSTLYGSEAVGGVIALSTARGAGPPSGIVAAEIGSFGSREGLVAAQGAAGPWSYNAGVADSHTDNDRVNNAFNSASAHLRVDFDLNPIVTLGATVRGVRTHYGDPSDEYTDNPYNYETEDNWLGTVFADVRPSADFSSHLILGGQYRDYDEVEPTPGEGTAVTLERARRLVADWQVAWQMTAGNRLMAGVTGENESFVNNGFGDVDHRQSLVAEFAEDKLNLGDRVYLTAGVRHDDFSTFGAATTGRLTAAWLVADRALKFRASAGTGFNQPSLLDLYGTSEFYVGNPALIPERSTGWDAGFDAYVPGHRGLLSASWFQNDFKNLIEDDFNLFPATAFNVERARTRGLELAGQTDPTAAVQFKGSFTRLEAEDETTQTPLLRRPHYTASADLWTRLGAGLTLGVGGTWVGIRPDVDALTFATVNDPGFDVARVYAAWSVTKQWTLKARVENALDRRYEPVNGYPALPRGFFGGAEWSF